MSETTDLLVHVFDLFDVKRNEAIDVGEFVRSLNVFHPRTPIADKISFAFRLYDLRHTGFIQKQELKEMALALLYESELTLYDDDVESIVNKMLIPKVMERLIRKNGRHLFHIIHSYLRT